MLSILDQAHSLIVDALETTYLNSQTLRQATQLIHFILSLIDL